MDKLAEGLNPDTTLNLSLFINYMRTCHPLQAQNKDSPFILTVKFFQTLPAEQMDELFLFWCVELIQKLKPVDVELEEPGVASQPKIDHDRLICVLNLISDLTFVPTVKAILTKDYIQTLQTILEKHYPMRGCSHMTEHKNRQLAKEICTELFLKS